MDIFRADKAPFSHTNGTAERRWHYGSATQGFRIVVTEIPPGHVQNEHRHDHLLDVIYVLEGQVQVYQRCDGELRKETLSAGDIACFEPPEFHNVANKSTAPARTLTLKVTKDTAVPLDVLDKLFKGDWIGYISE
jgi:quercetin dioxygenase-like cupin family protein